MKLKTFTIKAISKDQKMLKRLRKLTLYPGSGMNQELDDLMAICMSRKVLAKVICAYKNNIVGWAIVSVEPSSFPFILGPYMKREAKKYALIELFVQPKYRRQGIGTALINRAKQLKSIVKNKSFAIAPPTKGAAKFFKNMDTKKEYLELDNGEDLY